MYKYLISYSISIFGFFIQVTRIMGAEVDNPYDVVGVNHNMSTDKVKKR